VKTYGPTLNRTATAGNDDVMRAFIVNGTDRMPPRSSTTSSQPRSTPSSLM